MTSGNNIVPDRAAPVDNKTRGPNIENPYPGWEMVEEDPVQYKDQYTRNLDFVFGMIKKQGQISSLNKLVSVYQKPSEGDFVIVSQAQDNPNDIRIFEITNDSFGQEMDYDPGQFIRKVIEMADASGMYRDITEYADYGKVDGYLETAQQVERVYDTTVANIEQNGVMVNGKDNATNPSGQSKIVDAVKVAEETTGKKMNKNLAIDTVLKGGSILAQLGSGKGGTLNAGSLGMSFINYFRGFGKAKEKAVSTAGAKAGKQVEAEIKKEDANAVRWAALAQKEKFHGEKMKLEREKFGLKERALGNTEQKMTEDINIKRGGMQQKEKFQQESMGFGKEKFARTQGFKEESTVQKITGVGIGSLGAKMKEAEAIGKKNVSNPKRSGITMPPQFSQTAPGTFMQNTSVIAPPEVQPFPGKMGGKTRSKMSNVTYKKQNIGGKQNVGTTTAAKQPAAGGFFNK